MTTADMLSDRTLEDSLESATRFVLGVNALPAVRSILEPRGLTDEEIDKANGLIHEVLSIRLPSTQPATTPESRAQRLAVAWLDNWDEPTFREVSTILSNGFVSTRDWLFENLTPGEGADAILAARTFCHRYRQLQSGNIPGRGEHAAEDAAAFARLGQRGYGPAAIDEVEANIELAISPTPALPSPEDALALAAARRAKLVEIKQWYDEWAATARNRIRRKSYLITLGLASRRAPKPKTAPSSEEQ